MSIFFQSSPPFSEVGVRAFAIENPEGNFREIGLKVVGDKAFQVKKTCHNAIPKDCGIGFWNDLEFSFLETTFGKKRIREELKELKISGYKPCLKRAIRRGFVQLEINSREVLCIPPREFPLNPPRFYWKDTGQEIKPLGILSRWSSDLSLLQVVIEIKHKLGFRYYSRKWKGPKSSKNIDGGE